MLRKRVLNFVVIILFSMVLLFSKGEVGYAFLGPDVGFSGNANFSFDSSPPPIPASDESFSNEGGNDNNGDIYTKEYSEVFNDFVMEIGISNNLTSLLNERLNQILDYDYSNIREISLNEEQINVTLNNPIENVTLKDKIYEGLNIESITVEYKDKALIITGENSKGDKFKDIINEKPQDFNLFHEVFDTFSEHKDIPPKLKHTLKKRLKEIFKEAKDFKESVLVYKHEGKNLEIEFDSSFKNVNIKDKNFQNIKDGVKKIVVKYVSSDVIKITALNAKDKKIFEHSIFNEGQSILVESKKNKFFINEVTEILTTYNNSGEKEKVAFYYNSIQEEEKSLIFNLGKIKYVSQNGNSPLVSGVSLSNSNIPNFENTSTVETSVVDTPDIPQTNELDLPPLEITPSATVALGLSNPPTGPNSLSMGNSISIAFLSTNENYNNFEFGGNAISTENITNTVLDSFSILDSENVIPMTSLSINKSTIKKEANKKITIEGEIETKQGKESRYKAVVGLDGNIKITFFPPLAGESEFIKGEKISNNLSRINFRKDTEGLSDVQIIYTSAEEEKTSIVYIPILEKGALKTKELSSVSVKNIKPILTKLAEKSKGDTSKPEIEKVVQTIKDNLLAKTEVREDIMDKKIVFNIEHKEGEELLRVRVGNEIIKFRR